MITLPGLIAIFNDVIFDERAVRRRCVTGEDDPRAPRVGTGVPCDHLVASAQCNAIVRRRRGTRDNCVVRDGDPVCRRNIADGAAGGMAGSGLHVVVIDHNVAPVGHIDHVFARHGHLEGVVADGDVGSSGGAGATAAKCDTKSLDIRYDIARDYDLSHSRSVTAGSRQKETALRVVRVIV